MIPYPDVTRLPEELGLAVCRMVRLVNEMRRRYPDLEQFALSTETELDRRAAAIVVRHVERLGLGFTLLLSPWDGRDYMEGRGTGEP